MQQGKFFDAKKNPIDVTTVKQELNTLSIDLHKIAEVAERRLKSRAGQEHLPEAVPQVHSRRISMPDTIKALNEMSEQFKVLARML